MTTKSTDTTTHCAYCGHPIPGDADTPERFGERFCSEAHADGFVAGVRAARIETAARAEARPANQLERGGACALLPAGQRSWRDYVKRAACWGAPLLLLVAIPLFWSGGWGAAGGSLLSVIALLACPLGMYFMMRGMMNMNQPSGSEAQRDTRDKEGHHA